MTTRPARRTQAERRAETYTAVLDSATRLFGDKGYEATSIEEIAAACGLTIRPIYHYFGGKKALFEAVNGQMEERILERMQASTHTPDAAEAWRSFLALCGEPGFRQVVLVDAPTVLGRQRWESSPVTRAAFSLISDAGGTDDMRRRLIARMWVGALSEAALEIAESDDPDAVRREADAVVTRTLRALLDTEEDT